MAETEITAHASTVEAAADHAATTATTEGAAHTEAAEHSAGLPQFEFQHWAGQIAYLLILFVILYVLMSRVFGPRIRRVFDEREATIQGALASARAVQAEAAAQAEAARKALADAQGKAQRTAADAKAKSATEAAERQAAQETELQAKLSEAEARIRASRDKAMAQVGAIASAVLEAIVEKLTGAKVSAKDVSAALAKLEG